MLMGLFITFIAQVAFCQQSRLLMYFNPVKNDSIIDTRNMTREMAFLCSKHEINIFSDSISLKYFFNNDTSNLYYEYDGYNVDDNVFIHFRNKKMVCPLFYKKLGGFYLICYDIERITYLSIYDENCDKIYSTFIFRDFMDVLGNQITHSILFSNNHIASIETSYEGDVYYKLFKIDINNFKFSLIKELSINGKSLTDQEIYTQTYPILGINEKGEQIQ